MKKSYSLKSARVLNWNEQPSQSWQHTELFFRSWSFCGPWFTGHMGGVSCYLDVIQLVESNPQVNFMHPSALETAALAFLTATYGHRVYREKTGKMHYIGPLNWSTLEQLDVPSVQFDTEKTYSGANPVCHVFIPVSRSHIVRFALSIHQNASGTREEVDKKVDPAPFKELVDNIVGSIHVTLSPEAQADWDEIKNSNPAAKVSETCA
ncbi:hypothetical protein, partial [Thalassolituus sp. UBA2590]|uniref:hypothetical protein n=1 Tax=Thalassolituus sp. UBA2590 TaxID=1947663 RepID=UPI00264774F6